MASDRIDLSLDSPGCAPSGSISTQSVSSSQSSAIADALEGTFEDTHVVAVAELSHEEFTQRIEEFPQVRRSLKRKHSAEDTATTIDEGAWYHAEEHLQEVINFIQNYTGPRDLHMIDLFSASEQGFDTFVRAGFRAQSYDITNDEQDDVTTKEGFYRLLRYLLELVPGGVVLAGPPCSLYVFLSSSVHRRTIARPLGNTDHTKVRLSNLIVSNMCVAMKNVLQRGIKIIIEQPKSSMMFGHPAMTMLQSGPQQTWLHVHTFMGKFGHPMPKPTVLVTNLKQARLLARDMRQNDMRRLRAAAVEDQKVFTRRTPAGVAGGRNLHESSAYTRPFCEAVLAAWERYFRMVDHAAS